MTFFEDKSQIIWDDLISILDLLSASGKQIYFVVQPPELPEHIYRMVFKKDNVDILIKGVSRNWWEKRNLFVLDRLLQIPDNIKVVNVLDSFCDLNFCYANDINGYYYFDDNHISVYGASIIVENEIFKQER